VRAVLVALALLGATAAVQAVVLAATGSIALLADLIHNVGDALTAVPLGVAFWMRSERAEQLAGLAVVAAIFVSAAVAGAEAVNRLLHPQTPNHLVALALAGAAGVAGNWAAAIVRTRAGRRLSSPLSWRTARMPAPTPMCRSRWWRARPWWRSERQSATL
jgi:divalent metal cation (Fe/Co/Zn/Cd) transporter